MNPSIRLMPSCQYSWNRHSETVSSSYRDDRGVCCCSGLRGCVHECLGAACCRPVVRHFDDVGRQRSAKGVDEPTLARLLDVSRQENLRFSVGDREDHGRVILSVEAGSLKTRRWAQDLDGDVRVEGNRIARPHSSLRNVQMFE